MPKETQKLLHNYTSIGERFRVIFLQWKREFVLRNLAEVYFLSWGSDEWRCMNLDECMLFNSSLWSSLSRDSEHIFHRKGVELREFGN